MASNGTPDQRLREAEQARAALGATWRENLRWPDRGIGTDPNHLPQAVAFIRRHQPRTIAVPYWLDRHPDHRTASELLIEAAFTAGLARYRGEIEPWKADWICFYFINDSAPPSFVVDVSADYDRKRAALDCHRSQFQRGAGAAETRLNTPLFRQLVESRDAQFGALAGVRWAEGFIVRELPVRATLLK
jgi:bacillithiol biosynthesis deacetylase BshB1